MANPCQLIWILITFRFAAVNLDKTADVPGFDKVVDALAKDEQQRSEFLKACLAKLGLRTENEHKVPSLSQLHLSSISPSNTSELVTRLADIILVQDGQEFIQDENDKFCVSRSSMKSSSATANAISNETLEVEADQDRILDYSKITKHLLIHDDDFPLGKQTPYFSHHAFYANLEMYRSTSTEEGAVFGSHILYGEVVTSTNTLLEK